MPQWIDLDAGVPLGTFVFPGSADAAEAAGLAGLDFIIIDREHAPASWDNTIGLIRAAAAAGCPALVRVERLDPVEIGHAVDAGAAGVVVPRLASVADVRAAVAAARYAPVGDKGVCPGARNGGLGLRRRDYAGVTEESNRRFLLVGLIEDRRGIDDLDAILAEAPGLDLVLLGRSDLAADLGHVGNIRHPEVLAAVERYVAVAGASGKGAMVVVAGEDPVAWLDAGMRLLVQGIDIEILARGFAEAVAAHRARLQDRARGPIPSASDLRR
jgi:4-hydroxy-2-oxoheptanedioate aldolase